MINEKGQVNKNLSAGYLQVFGSAVIFGAQSIIVNLAYSFGISTLMFQLLRCIIAFLILAAVFGRSESFRVPMNAKDRWIAAGLSILGFALTSFLLFTSYKYIGPGAATSLHFTYPVIVTAMSAIFYKDRIRLFEGICLCLCMLGVACLYTPGGISIKGAVIALSSGIVYSLYTLFLDKTGITNRVGSVRLTCFMYAVAAAAFFVVCGVTGNLNFAIPLKGYAVCLLMALVTNIAAVIMYQNGVHLIGSKSTAIISAAEPVVGVIVGVLIFHELLTGRNIAGSVLIILSAILLVVLRKE